MSVAGRYRVVRRVGIGGAAEIFEVIDGATGDNVALKRLQSVFAENPNAVALFEREYHTLKTFEHPSIIRVLEYGIDGAPYFTMELLGGRDLRELAPLPYKLACRHLVEIASSLALLHTRRLLHRDVSPRNARVDEEDRCKLIDFGAIIPFGTSKHLVGTPPCVPPEAYYRRPLDQRADLYSLGAVAYFVLTKRHAYSARRFSALPEAWKTEPLPLSALQEGIPPELDDLVMSLLSSDPAERPGSAAEVIERLGHIADLAPETDRRVAHAYLRSPHLLGRDAELELLDLRLGETLAGTGASVWIEASAGLGKTRLVQELTVAARQRSAICICVDAEHQRGAFEIAEAIVWGLLEEWPEVALDAAAPARTVLAGLSPRVRRRLGVESSTTSSSAGERRAVLEAALAGFIQFVAYRNPVCIAVENVNYADQASAAFLLALTQQASDCSLLLVCTARSLDVRPVDETVAKIRERATVVKLAPLTRAEVSMLAESLFGRVRNVRRFGKWLERRSGGNPLYCLELTHQAVDTGLARYEHGTWTLPEKLPADTALTSLEEAFEFVLARLTPEARGLAEVLSAYRGALSPELCTRVGRSEVKDVHVSLSELVEKGVLVSHEDTYRFRQTALRELLLAELGPERREQIHRRLARALLAFAGDTGYAEVEAAWHLLHAGDETQGADLLARLFARSRTRGSAEMDLSTAVPALEAALAVYRRQNRHALERIPVLSALVEAGYYGDYRLAQRYADHALTELLEETGVARAKRLGPKLGRLVALGVGLGTARARFALAPRGPNPYSFEELLMHLFTVVSYSCGVATLCLDPATAKRYADLLEPFTVLGRKQAPTAVYDYCQRLVLMGQDRFAEARRSWFELLQELRDPEGHSNLPEDSRMLFLGGAWYALGVLESFRDDGSVLECCAELDGLGVKLYAVIADRLRVGYHSYRGEEDTALAIRERLDVHATQTASVWQVEVWDAAASITAFYREGDALGLKRCAERLRTLAKEIPSLDIHAKVAEGLHALLQGDPHPYIATYSTLRQYEHPKVHVGWAATLGQAAHAYNAAGQPERAVALCKGALQHLTLEDRDFVVMTLDIEIQLWLAEAALGRPGKAAEEIDALLRRFSDRGPVTLTRLHGARAEISILMEDEAAARDHLDAMEEVARVTHNASVLAQWRRVAQKLRSSPAAAAPRERETARLEPFMPGPTRLEQLRFAIPRLETPTQREEDGAEYTATESQFE